MSPFPSPVSINEPRRGRDEGQFGEGVGDVAVIFDAVTDTVGLRHVAHAAGTGAVTVRTTVSKDLRR